MIDFRYHVVSIVAVFLALTVGLVLGASFLNKFAFDNLNSQLVSITKDRNNLQQSNRALNAEIDSLNQYIGTTGPITVQDYLAGDFVTVIQIAGEDQGLAATTLNYLKAAGATVTSNITVNASMTDPAASTELAGTLAAQLPGQTLPGATPQLQAMNLLAQLLTPTTETTVGSPTGAPTGTPTGTPTTGTGGQTSGSQLTVGSADQILTALNTAGYINATLSPTKGASWPADLTGRPNLALIIAPTSADTTDQNTAYLTLAEALRAQNAQPVVVGAAENGTAGASADGGLVSAVISDKTANGAVYTVNNLNTTVGQVTAVFTLWQAASDPTSATKHYGDGNIGQVQAPLPALAPLPTPTADATGSPTGGATPGSP